jgi:hypothetical protein
MNDATAEQWEWDTNTGEIRRTNSPEPLDFTREREGRLATAAPKMARALLLNGCTSPTEPDSAWHTHDCWDNRRASCSAACAATRAALRDAGVPLP